MTMVGVVCWCLLGDQSTFALEGRVLQNKGLLLMKPNPGEEEQSHADQFAIAQAQGAVLSQDGTPISLKEIQPGALLQVTYSGEVLDTYPAQLAHVYTIRVLE